MNVPPPTIRLSHTQTLAIAAVSEYRLVEGRLKVTVKTPNGEYSVYVDEDLTAEGHAALRTSFPAGEKHPPVS